MKKVQILETILSISGGLLVFYYLFHKEWLLYVVFGLICTGLFSGFLSAKIHWAWMKLAEGLGYVNSRLLLSLIFFGFLTPIAWLFRLFNKSSLQLKQQKEANSYYVTRNHQYSDKDLENMW